MSELKQFNELQLALIQAKVNRFEALPTQSPRFYRDSWALVSSINRQVEDEDVKHALDVLKDKPDQYYWGEHRLPFDLFRLEKLLFIYSQRNWDITIDDLDVNLFTIEDILDNIRLELDILIDYIIYNYELAIKRNVFSLSRDNIAVAKYTSDEPIEDPSLGGAPVV